jgi:hypothetical protein
VSGVFNPSVKPANDPLMSVISHTYSGGNMPYSITRFLASRGTKHARNQNSRLWYVMMTEFALLNQ